VASPGDPVLVFDDTCGFCSRSVRFILRHDRAGTLRFAGSTSVFAQELTLGNPHIRPADSLLWVNGSGCIDDASDAVLRVAAYLGWPWSVVCALRAIPRPVRDAAYRIIARHRHRIGGPVCLVPDASQRARFIP
jgi:predicted DCC family thiol-disulfide oxidoreductase YuxK